MSDEKIAAAREYYEASNQEGAMTDSKDSFIPIMTQIITQQTGFSPPTEFVAIFESALERSIDEFWIKSGAYLEFFIIINAEIFTTEELAELTAFYKTPLEYQVLQIYAESEHADVQDDDANDGRISRIGSPS